MQRTQWVRKFGVLVVGVGVTVLGHGGSLVAWQDQEPVGDLEGIEVLTRGPLHEAFAEPVVFDPQPGIVAPAEPPPAIEELPPDRIPEGEDVQWISGYWAWDDERDDFLWVSGIWRDVPPDRRWVPGYWAEVEDGYQWISGFWAPTEVEEVAYLEPPPESLEEGPNTDPPSPNHTWVPGLWSWEETRYVWRTGFWIETQPDWIWVPAYYVWTPGGCIFVDGYWDYVLDRRGLVFAPVSFTPEVYTRPNFVYTPTITIVATTLTNYLFARPSYGHYYFGDYFAPDYFQAGIYPWFAFHQSRYGFDPLYSYYSVVNTRRDPDWVQQVRQEYRYLREHEEARPARTFAAQQTTGQRRPGREGQDLLIAQPLGQFVTGERLPFRFGRLDRERRTALARQSRDLVQLQRQRMRAEARAVAEGELPEDRDQRPRTTLELPKTADDQPRAKRERLKDEDDLPKAKRDLGKDEDQRPQAKRQRLTDEGQLPKAKRQRPTDEGQLPEAKRERSVDEDDLPKAKRDRPQAKRELSRDEDDRPRAPRERPQAEGQSPQATGEAPRGSRRRLELPRSAARDRPAREGQRVAPPPAPASPRPDLDTPPGRREGARRRPEPQLELDSPRPGRGPDRPTGQPGIERSRAQPRPDLAPDRPRPDLTPGRPRPELPKAGPRPEAPGGPRPELPKAGPRPERPKAGPQPGLPGVPPGPGSPGP